MITPKEIETKEFAKAKNGYRPEEVDDFLDAIYEDYSKLLSEKEMLAKKVVILNEKIEKYSAEQDKLKYSAINTQKNYDATISEARKKAEKIVSDAQYYAKKLIDTAEQEAEHQQQVKSTLTAEVEDFKSKLLALYENHVKLISDIPTIKTSVNIEKSDTLGMLEVATADAEIDEPEKEQAEEPAEEPSEQPAEKTEKEDNGESIFGDIDAGDTVVMPSISFDKVSFDGEDNDGDKDEEDNEDLYIPRRAQRVAPKSEHEQKEEFEDDEDDDEDDEKDSTLRNLFEKVERKPFFGGKKKGGLFAKKKNDDFDDDDEDDDDDDDEYYDDDDDE